MIWFQGPEVDLKHSNQESLREAGSLLLSMDDLLPLEQPQLFTRISALQRLKVQYVHNNIIQGLVKIREHLGNITSLRCFTTICLKYHIPTYLK